MRRAIRVAALLANVTVLATTATALEACREQRRPDGCPASGIVLNAACDEPPERSCSPTPGATSYMCQCAAGPDGRRAWSCVSAGGPLEPPELA